MFSAVILLLCVLFDLERLSIYQYCAIDLKLSSVVKVRRVVFVKDDSINSGVVP